MSKSEGFFCDTCGEWHDEKCPWPEIDEKYQSYYCPDCDAVKEGQCKIHMRDLPGYLRNWLGERRVS